MTFLSLFVLIPLLMLLGLWLSRNIAQIRAVMVTGASALLVLFCSIDRNVPQCTPRRCHG